MEVDVVGFVRGAAEVLELDAERLSLETEFRTAVPDWSSLLGYGLILWMEESYGFVCPVAEFQKARYLGDLLALVNKHG
jgi:acyl carrier protein